YLAGKKDPSIIGILAGGRKYERYFFGTKEMVIPVYPAIASIPEVRKKECIFFLNVTSGRRVLPSSLEALSSLPRLVGGVTFAEDVPEQHAIELRKRAEQAQKFILGPASVGLLVPGRLKLG